ncbi:hypothetical protein F5Y09DRAFT_108757 [Xylaria sp. FL1042]|nr:hypothetical protein F5Y09DRAFT_108757 [Xylaria sp. FL1042]
MRHTKGLLTPARALHRVLLLELANATTLSKTILLPPPPSSSSLRTACLPTHVRTLQQPSCLRLPTRRPFSTTSSRAYAASSKFPRDKDIPFRWVRIAETSGKLSAPQRRDNVLAGLEEGWSLVMVAPPPPPSPEPTDPTSSPILQSPPAAICRLVNAAAESAAAEAAVKEAKQTAANTKTLELNWAIAPHDLSYKMRRLAEFLGKGLRVELMLARKRGGRKATAEEEEELVERILQTVAEVPGAAEYKKMDGRVGGVLRMFYEGPEGKRKEKRKDKDKDKDKDKGNGNGNGNEE